MLFETKRPMGFRKFVLSIMLLISGLGFSLQASADFVVGGTCNIADPVNPPANVTDCSSQDLDGADLSGINLSHADFSNAILTNVLFDTSDFTDARFSGVDWTGASFAGVTWDNTICPDDTNSNQYLDDGNGCLGTFTDDDGDGVRNADDAFPSNDAASIDGDSDGYPDLWNKNCNAACQSASGLLLDMFPGNVAASQDDDNDGFPDAWNAGCDTGCQTGSGLVEDAGIDDLGAVFVDINSPTPYGTADGTSWSTAFPNVADALAVATPGQEIWIATGVYYPDEAAGGNTDAASANFTLVDQVNLVGGFVGNETMSSQRDPKNNPVVLNGDIEQNDTNREGGVGIGVHTGFETGNTHNGANSINILYANAVAVTSQLSDLIISGGGHSSTTSGGGLLCNSARITFKRVQFLYNRATSSGGAVYCNNDSAGSYLEFRESYLKGNSALIGGGVAVTGGDMWIERSAFTDNKATQRAGALSQINTKTKMINSTFAYNTADDAGAIHVDGGGSVTTPPDLDIAFSTFAFNGAIGNTATGFGGGIYLTNFANVEMIGSAVTANTAANALTGSENIYRTPNSQFFAQYTKLGSGGSSGTFLQGTGAVTLPVFLLGGAEPTVSVMSGSIATIINNTLVDHGGHTPVLSLPNSSVLINGIPEFECNNIFMNSFKEDQRGLPRPYEFSSNDCDTGAYERNDFDNDGQPDNLDPDIDGDTMSNDFENLHGLNPYNPADATLDPDGDTIPNNADDFPNNIAASVDNDGDGYPDFFNPGCDTACISSSGLNIDNFPVNDAASFDADDDGFPDAWNAGCDAACQTGSGLVLDAGQLYVDITRPWAGSNGLSWATAFPNVADALAVASPGKEIWIAQGVYYPDKAANGNTNSVSATFTLQNHVNLVGGFTGYNMETMANQADPMLYPVVLSGDIDGTSGNDTFQTNGVHDGYENGVTFTHNGANADVIVTGNGVSSRIAGVIISGGGSGGGPNNNGAGISCTSCDLYLHKVKLLYNRVVSGGGAIHVVNSGSQHVILEDVLIEGSYTQNGYGGGIYVSGGLLDIHRSTIAFNTALYGGGISTQNSAKAVINNSTLSNNIAIQRGGGMYIVGSGAMSGQPYLQMNMSTVAFNEASTGGGGLWTTNSVDSYLDGSVFVGNTSPTFGANIYRGSVDVFEADYSSFGSATDGGLSLQGSNANLTTFLSSGFNPTVTIPTQGTTFIIDSTLQDNGGFTPTLAIPLGSPLIDVVSEANCQPIFNAHMDQRGIQRPYQYGSNFCDIGAFERNDFDFDGMIDNFDLDIDGDGMDNTYETGYALNPYDETDAVLDYDSDTLTNLDEFNLGTDPYNQNSSEPEIDLVISPRYHRYGFESASCQTLATPVTYTIFNNSVTPRNLGVISLDFMEAGGTWQLVTGQDSCSSQTLVPYSSCTFQVVYCDAGSGNQTGIISVPTDDVETPTLTSALYNFESDQDEAQRRLPPVLSDLVIRDSSLNVVTDGQIKGGETHTYEWTITGYHPDYQSLAAVFNCNLIIAGSCGLNYSSNFDNSGMLSPDIVDVGTWTYNGIVANTYTYTASFTLPYEVTESNEWVMRFFQIPEVDMVVGNSSLSLMIPGNIMPTAANYYDSSGRRIILNVIP